MTLDLQPGDILADGHPFAGLRYRHYRCISIDPPTKFVAGTKSRPQHYKRMTDHEIAALPVNDLMHPEGCWAALWVTSPKLYRPMGSKTRLRPDELAHAWKCRYSARGWIWIKLHKSLGEKSDGYLFTRKDLHRGQGLTTGKNAEDCLLFKFRAPRVKSRGEFEVIIDPRREHSRKPDEYFERLQRFAAGPYAELFAREPRENWDVWGDEFDKFAPGALAA